MATRGRPGGAGSRGAGGRHAIPRLALDEKLAELQALRAELTGPERGRTPPRPEALARLREAIESPSSFVVARAAAIVSEAGIHELLPPLGRAFERFVPDGAERDPGCAAKLAIVEALLAVDQTDPAPLLLGIRHVQREAQYGPPVDTAAALRAACAVGLANRGHPAALDELSRLLADAEPPARAGAARALGATGSDAALPLLRYKILVGDESPEVLGECCAALLGLHPPSALALLAERLAAEDEAVVEPVALALGQSRLPEALPILIAHGEQQLASRRRVALVAIGLLRTREATEYLIAQIEEGELGAALHAVSALAIQKHDAALRARVERAVEGRDVPSLRAQLDRELRR